MKGTRFTEADAEARVHGICFKTGPPEQVGVELEWLVRDRRDPALPVQAEQVAATLAGFGAAGDEGYMGQAPQPVPYKFPSGASLTLEPGGQLELSSAPAGTLSELHEVTGRDLAALRDAAALRRALVAADRGQQKLIPALAGYERDMIEYGFSAVRTSLADMERFHAERGLSRALTKAAFRAAESERPAFQSALRAGRR